MTPTELRAEIDAAVRDYRLTYPEPWPLSPNLRLMVAARGEMDRLVEVCDSWGQNYESWTVANANLILAQHIEEEARLFEQARANAAEARLNALTTVHARYFDMDCEAGEPDVNPSPEDVWRYDRDFRLALEVE